MLQTTPPQQIDRRDNGTIRLRIDDEVVATRQVRVPDGESRQLNFSVRFDEPGQFNASASLRGQSATGREDPEGSQQITTDVVVTVDTGPSCELFGVNLGHFLVCWYWWVLAALGAALARLLRQVWYSSENPDLVSKTLSEKGDDDD